MIFAGKGELGGRWMKEETGIKSISGKINDVEEKILGILQKGGSIVTKDSPELTGK